MKKVSKAKPNLKNLIDLIPIVVIFYSLFIFSRIKYFAGPQITSRVGTNEVYIYTILIIIIIVGKKIKFNIRAILIFLLFLIISLVPLLIDPFEIAEYFYALFFLLIPILFLLN